MVRDVVADTIGYESVDLSTIVADAEALQLVPQDFARSLSFVACSL